MADTKVICIGGAPSSGTTLLADLLDSVPGIICGPELNIFCIKEAYSFNGDFKSRVAANQPFDTGAAYAPRSTFFNRRHLGDCGLTEHELMCLVNESASIKQFVERLAHHCGAVRDRYLKVFAEKTPINVSAAEEFCSYYPDGLFIHVVRDGRSVVASLLRRGFPLYAAAFVWMAQTMAGQQASQRCDNLIQVAFEDLLNAPFTNAVNIARRLGIEASESEVEQKYKSNEFRRSLPRVASWSTGKFTGEVRPPTPYDEVLSESEVALLESLVLVNLQANGRATFVKRFSELLAEYKYPPTTSERRPIPVSLWQRAYRELYADENHAYRLRHERRKMIIDPRRCKWFVPGGAVTKDWLSDLRHIRWPTRLKSFLVNHPLVMAQIMMMSSMEFEAKEKIRPDATGST